MQFKGVTILGFNPGSSAEKAGLQKGDVIIGYGGVWDLTIDKLTTLKAVTGLEGTGARAVFVRDGQEHSVNLPPGPLGISAADSTIHDSAKSGMTRTAIESVVQTIQKIYLVLVVMKVLFVLGVLAGLTPPLRSVGAPGLLQSLLITILYCFIYYGLRGRKKWVITLVLIFSALSIVPCIFDVLYPAENVKALLGKLIVLLYLSFCGYQIYFFRRPDVRERFGDRGVLVF
jgi:hypothetical protein